MQISMAFTLTLLVLGITACSGGGGNSGGGPGPGPQSPEEALQKLSPEHRASFENWQNQVVKSCSPSEAFGLTQRNTSIVGIDGAALIKKNDKSVVFSEGNTLVILAGYNSFSGVAEEKLEETVDNNGQVYTLTAETQRQGSSCTLLLHGQKVFETYIVESFTVGTQYAPGKEAVATSQSPVIKPLGVNGASEVIQHGIYALISEVLRPAKEAHSLLGRRLGLNAEQSAKLFKLRGHSADQSAVRIDEESSAVWSNTESQNLIAAPAVLKRAFDGASRTLNLEVRLQIPQFNFNDTKNSADNGNLKLLLSSSIAKKETAMFYTLKDLQFQGKVPWSESEAVTCVQDRFAAYSGSSTANGAPSPALNTLFSPCQTLWNEIETVSYKNGLLKSFIPTIFANVIPSRQAQYAGWDTVLSHFAKEVLLQGKDIIKELDPENKTRIVPVAASTLEVIHSEITGSKNMTKVMDSTLQMGLDWVFEGISVSDSKISQIIRSVDNATDVFQVSSQRLLSDLARNPNGHEDQLSFALSLDAPYKNEALHALALSKELQSAAYENEVFDRVIQKKVTMEELKTWSARFSTIKTELNKFPSLSPVKGELVNASLKWFGRGELSPQDLSGIYSALNNSIDPFDESTRQLIREMGQTLDGSKEALAYASSITPETKQLAIAIRNNATAADFQSWGSNFFNSILQKRPTIEQVRQWNDFWSSAIGFVQREKARIADDRSSMPEWNRKRLLENAVKEIWPGKDFAALEIIAPVAIFKSSCSRYKDASSQADCAGLGLFSNAPKKFFDPNFNGRYSPLATEFVGYLNQLSDFSWSSMRWALVEEFFGSFEPIWSKCDATAFQQKSSTLKTQINALVAETDQLKKWELERSIKETIQNCR